MTDAQLQILELETKLKSIKNKAEVFKTCKDGSYEAALHYEGYYTLLKELKQLRGE